MILKLDRKGNSCLRAVRILEVFQTSQKPAANKLPLMARDSTTPKSVMIIQVTAVPKIHKKVIRLSCAEVNILVREGNPAFSYSFPKLRRRSQKWGTCHIKKKDEMARILGSRGWPPPATQPIRGETPPIIAPGITANAVLLFR